MVENFLFLSSSLESGLRMVDFLFNDESSVASFGYLLLYTLNRLAVVV